MRNIMKLKLALLGICITLAGLAYAQGAAPEHAHQHTLVVTKSGKTMMPGGIDGSTTPELIPGAVAYRVFMRALTVNPKTDRPQAFLEAGEPIGGGLRSCGGNRT